MIEEIVGVTAGKKSIRLHARLDLDRLDPSALPDVITGSLDCADGSVEEFLIHAEDEKRMWFWENEFSYRLAIEKGAGNRFVARKEGIPPGTVR